MSSKHAGRVLSIAGALVGMSLGATASAATLYDLSTVVRDDGSASENTYHIRNNASVVGSLTYDGGNDTLAWAQNGGNSFSYIVGYYNAATIAAVGDSITLNYTATLNGTVFSAGNPDVSFRTALINSGGTRLTGDITGNSDAAFSTDTGYAAYYRTGTGTPTANDTFYQRSGSNAVLFGTGAGAGFGAVASAPTLPAIGTPSTLTGTFVLTRVATGVEIKSTVNGGATQTVVDTSGLDTTFDGFGFFATSGSNLATLTFTTLEVTTGSAVPEPGTIGLALFIGSALLMGRRGKGAL